MNDKTPAPDQNPTPDENRNADAPTVPVEPTADPAAASATAPVAPTAEAPAAPNAAPQAAAPTGRKRAWLIGGGIAAAVLLVGGGVAVGAAIADEFGDDDRPAAEGPRHDDDHRGDGRSDERDDRPSEDHGRGPATGIGAASADELIDIADAARGAADGDVTSIDAKRDGTWEVQLTTASGDETEVRVDKELSASVVSTETGDEDDAAPALILDDDTIRALVDAALAETDGMITDLDVDSDDVSPYDASVLTSDNRSIDIDFDASFAVVGTDIDD